jgi:hypothetical protein
MSMHPGAPNNWQRAYAAWVCTGRTPASLCDHPPTDPAPRACATPGCLRTVPSTRDCCLGCGQGSPLRAESPRVVLGHVCSGCGRCRVAGARDACETCQFKMAEACDPRWGAPWQGHRCVTCERNYTPERGMCKICIYVQKGGKCCPQWKPSE